jgi:uncharacterized delta-60 repeat protein
MKRTTVQSRALFAAFLVLGPEGTASAASGVARFTPNGALDTTFNNTGRLTSGGYFDIATSVITNGPKIYTGGSFVTNSGTVQIIIGRLNSSDGTVDTSFGWLGVTTAFFSGAIGNNREVLYDLDLDSSGRVLALAASDDGSNCSNCAGVPKGSIFVVRFQTNGAQDTSFGNQGFALPLSPSIGAVPVALKASPDGGIVETHYVPSIEGPEMDVTKFNSSGQVTWSERVSWQGVEDIPGAMLVDSRGSIILTGMSQYGNLGVMRLLPSGRFDTTFSGDGKDLGFAGAIGTGVDIDANGRILVVGNYYDGSSSRDTSMVLERWSTSGVRDTNWSGVYSPVANGTGTGDDKWHIHATFDDKYVVGGSTQINGQYQFVVGRLLSTSFAFDSSFGTFVGATETAFPGYANAKAFGLTMGGTNNRPILIGTLY